MVHISKFIYFQKNFSSRGMNKKKAVWGRSSVPGSARSATHTTCTPLRVSGESYEVRERKVCTKREK
jgi:hypothetical protein